MSSDFVIDAFGARWSLGTDALSPDEAARLRVLWERCRVPGLRADGAGVVAFPVSTGDPYAVSRAVTLASLRRRRGEAVLLHAVGLSEGERALALVGPSGAGKSTAAVTLGQEFGYLSDETVAVEADGRVAAYPKPVSLVADPERRWVKREWSPDELGLREASHPAYLRGVVVLERDPACTTAELTPMPLVDALLAVTAQSSSLPMVPRPLHRLADLLSGLGGPFVLRYAEIADCVDLIRTLMNSAVEEQSSPPRDGWTSTPGCGGTPTPTPGTVVRAPWTDAVHGEGGSVVLVGDDLVRLGPLGEVIWQASSEPAPVDELREVVVRAHGEHPEAGAIVERAIDDLAQSGVLHVGR